LRNKDFILGVENFYSFSFVKKEDAVLVKKETQSRGSPPWQGGEVSCGKMFAGVMEGKYLRELRAIWGEKGKVASFY